MVKGVAVFLILFMTAALAFAEEARVDIANIEKNLRYEMLEQAIDPPDVRETYEYYEIAGNDERELRRQMSQNGTKWNDGKTYDAVTSWRLKWDYDYNCSSQGCTVDAFKTIVHVTFRYPKWVRPNDAAQPLVAKWDGYMANLIVHENGHRDIAVQAAADIALAARELSAPTRAELDRKVAEMARNRTAKLNADSREYDATTTHGSTQGAVFP